MPGNRFCSASSAVLKTATVMAFYMKFFQQEELGVVKQREGNIAEMFIRANFTHLEQAVIEYTTKGFGNSTDDLKHGLKTAIYYLIKKACKLIRGMYLIDDEDDKASDVDKFIDVFELSHDYLFGDATYAMNRNRNEKLRKPEALPLEEDIAKVREYTLFRMQAITKESYVVFDTHNFVELRDLLVSRLTLFKCKAGRRAVQVAVGTIRGVSGKNSKVDNAGTSVTSSPKKKTIDNAMVSAGIENWKEKLVGAGCDGAKVNVGINNNVATRMQGDGREHVVIVHCVAHRLELAILGAIKENEMLQTVQDMLNKIHKHCHYSPKALRELEMVAEAMGEKFLKPQRLSGTRWVHLIRRALQVLISKYSVILAHFEHVKFQKDDVTAVDVLDALDTATFSLVELGQRPGNTLQNFLDTVADSNGKYKGVLLMNYNDGTVAGHYQDIVGCTIDHISNRLSNSRDKARPVLEAARIFDVRDWPTTRTDLPPYGNQELDTLL
ncbi:hypothetical protein HOLleu_03349 [Holothuria leucospilota]|uniref:Zinc finger protein 862-like n=1 Tax=Holothuria leucospilota TaxID=206669 RepID=A0A9Q1CSG5_HOLLE|nr:hypothetical protein HOLleu_03349 [Holothuria leucospilota]